MPTRSFRSSLAVTALCAVAFLTAGCVASDTSSPDIGAPPSAEPPLQDPGFLGNAESFGGSEEWNAATAEYDQCMRDAGWEWREGPGGTIFGFAVGQEDAFAASDLECNEQSGRSDIVANATISPEEMQDGYDAIVLLTACLSENGYSPPTPPSVQAFSELEGNWSPYMFIDESVIADALEICPQPAGN